MDAAIQTVEIGIHTVCAIVTDDFLQFALSQGNDLITPAPQFGFPGLRRPADGVFVLERKDAAEAGVACPIVLEATQKKHLRYVTLRCWKAMQQSSIDKELSNLCATVLRRRRVLSIFVATRSATSSPFLPAIRYPYGILPPRVLSNRRWESNRYFRVFRSLSQYSTYLCEHP